jgi:hypothetical protein
MALTGLSLLALYDDKRIGPLFADAIARIESDLEENGDVEGVRTVNLKLKFTVKKATQFVDVEASVETKVPNKTVSTLAALGPDSKLQIDTISGNAAQPDMFDQDSEPMEGVVQFPREAAEGGTR